MRKLNKLVSFVIIITFFIQYLPYETFAALHQNNVVEPPITFEQPKEKKMIGEVLEKREKNVKHFLKEDMTFEAVIYPSAVHYKDGAQWKDIDNTLVEKVNEAQQPILENKQNRYKVRLAKNTNANKLVKIKKDNYEVSWSLTNSNTSTAQIRSKDVNFLNSLSENERKKTLMNIKSVVDYPNVFPNVDLSYEVLAESVKENIVIKAPVNQPSFTFELQTKGLIPELQADQSIIFYDGNDPSKKVFTIDAPFMYDAAGALSEDILVELKENKNGYLLTVTPSHEWINNRDRVFPITVDPTLSTSLDATKIYDNHVSENYPTTNYMTSIINKTGYGSSSGRNRTFLSFDLPTLSTGDLITGANLYLNLYSDNSSNSQVNVQKVEQNWGTTTITWNNQPSFSPSVVDYELINGLAGDLMTWEITEVVKEWYSKGVNNGLMLKNENETGAYNDFVSSDTSTAYAGLRPQVILSYINNTGLENYWTYHSQDVGRAGTGYVNDYNGNLVFVHNDVSMSGNRMPVSINHVYNSNDRDTDIGYGPGWRLNLTQKVEFQEIDGSKYYLYTDEDGTIHYLKEDAENSTTYKDQSGLNVTLTIDSASTAERYVITDKKDNKLSFNTNGDLTFIKDNNGNDITLTYTNSLLTEVTDGAGRSVTLNYTNGTLTSIVDPSNQMVSFAYPTPGEMNITYPDNNVSTFVYDANNNLQSVTNPSGYQISYTYDTSRSDRVKKFKKSTRTAASEKA